MSAVDMFGWVIVLLCAVTVAIWFIVGAFVLQGAFNLCRDIWRAIRSKA